MKTNPQKKIALISALSLLGLAALTSPSWADETVGEKIESKAEDTKNATKKNWRKAKKKVRDATGNSNVGEDIKDGAKNVGDDVSSGAKKLKNKVD